MLRISTINESSERRLVVEGTLVQPWVAELKETWRNAREGLQGRKLVIDLSNATVISREAEDELLELMKEGAKFSCCGVLTKYVVKQLAHRCQARSAEKSQETSK
jgi:hypothetical protein